MPEALFRQDEIKGYMATARVAMLMPLVMLTYLARLLYPLAIDGSP